MVSFHDPKTILGLRLKLACLLLVQWIGWFFFALGHFPLVLDHDAAFVSALGSAMALAALYVVHLLLVMRGSHFAKKSLTYINLGLLAAALYLPFFPRLLQGRGVHGVEAAYDAAGSLVSWESRLFRAESVLSLSELWPNLLILLCVALILNLLREHTLLRLWDRPQVVGHDYNSERLSVGNSLILGVFLWLAFYTSLLLLPDSSLWVSAKRLFFGEHALYYVQMLVFWWAVSLLLVDYLAVRSDLTVFSGIHRRFARLGLQRITPHEALPLLKELEAEYVPLDRSQVSHRIGRLLEIVIEAKLEGADAVLERLEDIEFRARESNRGFLGTLLWSLPLLGFMGTIIGIIKTIAAFSGVLTEGGGRRNSCRACGV